MANRHWIASTTSNWNNTANWSDTSGGSGGFSIPGASDDVFFNSSGPGNCTFDGTSIDCLKMDLSAKTYLGILDNSVNNIAVNIGSGGLDCGTGAAIATAIIFGAATWTVNGTFRTSTVTITTTGSSVVVTAAGNLGLYVGETLWNNFTIASGAVYAVGNASSSPSFPLLCSGIMQIDGTANLNKNIGVQNGNFRISSTGIVNTTFGASEITILLSSSITQFDGITNVTKITLKNWVSGTQTINLIACTFDSPVEVYNSGYSPTVVFGAGTFTYKQSFTAKSYTGYSTYLDNSVNSATHIFQSDFIITGTVSSVVWKHGTTGLVKFAGAGSGTQTIDMTRISGDYPNEIQIDDAGATKKLLWQLRTRSLTCINGTLDADGYYTSIFGGNLQIDSGFTWIKGVQRYGDNMLMYPNPGAGSGSGTQTIDTNNADIGKLQIVDLGATKQLLSKLRTDIFIVSSGTLDSNDQDIDIYQDFTVNPAAFWTKGTGTVTFIGAGDYNIDSNDVPIDSVVINKSSGMTLLSDLNVDSFTLSTGTMDTSTFDITTVNDFDINYPGAFNLTNLPGSTITVGGLFNSTGSAGNIVLLNPASTWYLNVTGNNSTLTYTNLGYCNASGGSTINAFDGTNTDSLNNTNVAFTDIYRYWISTITSNWNNSANWSRMNGGTTSGDVPSSSHEIEFFPSANGNCNVDLVGTVTVNKISFNQYTGKVYFTVNNNDVNIAFLDGNSSSKTAELHMGSGTWTCSRKFDAGSSNNYVKTIYGTSKLIMSSTATYVTSSTGFYDLEIAVGATVNLTCYHGSAFGIVHNNLTIKGTANIVVNYALNKLYVEATGVLTSTTNKTMVFSRGSTSGIPQMDGSISMFTGSQLYFSTTGTHSIAAGTYDTTLMFRPGSGAVNFLTGDFVFNERVQFSNEGAIDNSVNNPNFTFSHNLYLVGSSGWVKGTGTITFAGAGAGTQTINTLSNSIEDIVINDSGATKQLSSDLITDSFTLLSGTFDMDGFDMYITEGDLTLTAGTWNNSVGASNIRFTGTVDQNYSDSTDQTVDNIVVNKASGTFIFLTNTKPYSFFGNNGNININNKNITTQSAFAIDSGADIVPVTGLNGITLNVGDTFDLSGSAGNILDLKATAEWLLNVSGVSMCIYVDVSNSNADGGLTIQVEPLNSIDSGNNSNWSFSVGIVRRAGARFPIPQLMEMIASTFNAPKLGISGRK